MPPIDHTPTHVIPRQPSDTSPVPAIGACPRACPCPGWRRAATAALVLAWVALVLVCVALAEAAWWLGRFAWLLWAWR